MEKLRLYAQFIPITFESWVVSFVGIILVRALRQFSSFKPGEFILIDGPAMMHGIVFYLVTIIALMIILMYFGKTSIKEVFAICLFGFFVIWIAPIIDPITGGVGGHAMGYIFAPGKELLVRFLTFFGGHITYGITLGIQIETVLGIMFCFAYVYSATKNILRAIGASVAFYCFIFFIVSVPSLIALFLTPQNTVLVSITQSLASSHIIQNNLNPNFMATNNGLLGLAFDKLMIGVNAILVILGTLYLFFLGMRKKLMAIIKNSRPERIFHFFLLFVFGASLVHTNWFASWIDVQSYILAFIAFTSAWMYSVCQNDIYDETIDAVSNPDRPLIAKDLSKNDLEVASKIFLLLAFISAYASGHYVLFFTGLFTFVYYIYSNPPLRLKRFVILNSFLVSLACLSIIMAGFFLASTDKTITAFPFGFVVAIIIFFSVVTNIRD